MTPFFSIIIPVYNVAQYLRECLDSVLSQTFTDWEAVCVDDGSTDGSGKILDEYGIRDQRIKVIHKHNGGVSSARNAGLAVANGKYIWFVDGDDVISDGSLSFLSTIISRYGSPDVVNFTISRKPIVSSQSEYSLGDIECVKRDVEDFWAFKSAVYRSVISRSVLEGLSFAHMAIGEDALFHLLVYYRIKTGVRVNVPLYYYRDRPGSAIKSMGSVNMVRDWISLQMRIFRILRDNNEFSNPYLKSFLRWNSDYVFYTPNLALFKLPLKDLKLCFDSWQKLVIMAGKSYRYKLWKRILFKIILMSQSSYCARYSIIFAYNLITGLDGLLHVIGVRKD